MKLIFPLIALSLAGASSALAQQPQAPVAPPPAAASNNSAPAETVSVETTSVEELLENPKAMELLIKHFPDFKGQEDQLAQAGSMTLRDLQAFAGDELTDEKLEALEADFKALPHS